MKVLVVGATGGSGRAAVRQLLARGHEVTALTRGTSGPLLPEPRLRMAHGDATELDDVRRAMEAPPHVSAAGALGRMKVARASVGRVLADAVESPHWVGRCLAVSSAPKISRALAPPAR